MARLIQVICAVSRSNPLRFRQESRDLPLFVTRKPCFLRTLVGVPSSSESDRSYERKVRRNRFVERTVVSFHRLTPLQIFFPVIHCLISHNLGPSAEFLVISKTTGCFSKAWQGPNKAHSSGGWTAVARAESKA